MKLDLPQVRGEYRYDAKLSHLTWFKVGGSAQVLYKPHDLEDLQYFLQHLDRNIPYVIIGAGSNLLIRDGGVEGVVIKLPRAFTEIKLLPGARIACGAASLNFNVAHFAAEYALSGLEFLVGIPGSIGGGVWMNAGCYGSEFRDVLDEVTILMPNGEVQILPCDDINFQYRKSNLPQGCVVVSAIFKLHSGDSGVIRSKMNSITDERKSTQPQGVRTGGSSFANPTGEKKAWQLIDAVGLRGHKIGGASFSEKHCNFMVSDGNATAKELEELGELARKRIKAQNGVDIHWEIKRIGKQ